MDFWTSMFATDRAIEEAPLIGATPAKVNPNLFTLRRSDDPELYDAICREMDCVDEEEDA